MYVKLNIEKCRLNIFHNPLWKVRSVFIEKAKGKKKQPYYGQLVYNKDIRSVPSIYIFNKEANLSILGGI